MAQQRLLKTNALYIMANFYWKGMSHVIGNNDKQVTRIYISRSLHEHRTKTSLRRKLTPVTSVDASWFLNRNVHMLPKYTVELKRTIRSILYHSAARLNVKRKTMEPASFLLIANGYKKESPCQVDFSRAYVFELNKLYNSFAAPIVDAKVAKVDRLQFVVYYGMALRKDFREWYNALDD